jgi:hypothetical protein
MRNAFGFGLKEIAAASILSCFIVGGVGAVTGPGIAGSDESMTVSVNRTHKGDRLIKAALSHQRAGHLPSTGLAPASPQRTPLGCDPAFSPVVEPALAHIFKRCLA